MLRTLSLITLLMAPFAVQAQTVELGPGDSTSFRTVVATAGSCAPPACTRKNWAKPAWATVSGTGNFALATRAAPIIIAGMGTKSIEASVVALTPRPGNGNEWGRGVVLESVH